MATDLENFYRENRIREADSVNNIYNDPRYASTILNSSVPLSQLEKNIQQSQGNMLEPAYNPTFRDESSDYITSALEYLESKGIMDKSVREGKATSRDVSESFSGTEDSMGLLDFTPMGSLYAAQEGQRKIMKAEPDALKRAMGLLSFMRQPLQTYLDRPQLSEGAFDVATGATEAFGLGLLAKPVAKKFKDFAGSLSKKLSGGSDIVPTKQEVGVLPKVMANTKLQAPNMVMTDPKVVDEFGFYSEAERQAKMMQQNKGSGAQFQGMLLNKGVKLDEIKALGLDDLFKNEKVTKKEIVDTIDLNKFQLIEKKRIGTDSTVGYEMESFTDIRGTDGSSFANIDEIKNAQDTGKYERPVIRYEDGTFNGFETAYEGEQLTHIPTQHKIVRVQSTDSNRDEVFFTFKPEANTNDWRNSNEAKQYLDSINEARGGYLGQLERSSNLTQNDFDTIIREYAPYSFDEATVRLKSAAEDVGNAPFAKFESNTQKGGENYKEFVLSLPPIDKTKGYQDKVDIRFPSHFPEYNPVFHIRTKDRVTTDGKKVLYVEELQSDFGQQGRERGFKLKGDDLKKAKAKLAVAEDDLLKLKDIKVKLTPSEVENLFKLKNPKKIMLDPMDEDILNTVKSFTAESDVQLINPYKAPPEYAYATIEEVAKLRQYENYKALHKLGDLTDEFFDQLDLNQMVRTQDELKSEIIQMFGGERLDRGSVTYPYKDEFQSGNANITRDQADDIIKKYYKSKNQTKGEDAPIPDAPFVKDTEKWTGLAIKRLLQMAEKGEYDHIAFSPGSVQFDRWGDEGLIKYYDEIIPSVARDTTKKMKDKSVNMNTTGFVNIEIPTGKTLSIAEDAREGFYIYDETGNTMIQGNKFFDTKEEAREFIKNNLDMTQKGQETFAINITPKIRETVRGGMPLFSTVGGMVGLGALGDIPSTQGDET